MRGTPFILLRNKSDVNISDSWLSEYIKNKYDNLMFFTRTVVRGIKAMYFSDGENEYLFCYCMYLSLAEKYKSNYIKGFEKVKYILLEEAIPNKPLIQSVNYIRQYMLDDLIDLMSIKSTVCRSHNAKVVMLGNDIAVNLINPMTVCFDLLERLTPDTPIIDKVVIDDRTYNFYFLYFSFDGSVEHWLVNEALDVNATINITKEYNKIDIILLTNFNKYYIYKHKNYVYISDRNIDNQYTFCNNPREFFAKYGVPQLYDNYKLDIALLILNQGGVSSSDIAYYFGAEWYKNPQFNIPHIVSTASLINIYELNKMKYNDILNLSNYAKILTLQNIIENNTIIYSNVQVKILLNDLINKLTIIT